MQTALYSCLMIDLMQFHWTKAPFAVQVWLEHVQVCSHTNSVSTMHHGTVAGCSELPNSRSTATPHLPREARSPPRLLRCLPPSQPLCTPIRTRLPGIFPSNLTLPHSEPLSSLSSTCYILMMSYGTMTECSNCTPIFLCCRMFVDQCVLVLWCADIDWENCSLGGCASLTNMHKSWCCNAGQLS